MLLKRLKAFCKRSHGSSKLKTKTMQPRPAAVVVTGFCGLGNVHGHNQKHFCG